MQKVTINTLRMELLPMVDVESVIGYGREDTVGNVLGTIGEEIVSAGEN